MKNISKAFIVFCLAVVGVALFTSCATKQEKFIKNLEAFVTSVEEDFDNLTRADWDALDDECSAYYNEYKEYSREFTREQQRKITQLFTKYGKLRVKSIGTVIGDYCGIVQGIMDGLGIDIDSLSNSFSDILDNF